MAPKPGITNKHSFWKQKQRYSQRFLDMMLMLARNRVWLAQRARTSLLQPHPSDSSRRIILPASDGTDALMRRGLISCLNLSEVLLTQLPPSAVSSPVSISVRLISGSISSEHGIDI
jgi:hypothetical protein